MGGGSADPWYFNKMTNLAAIALLAAGVLSAQPEGLWQGYDGEWGHVSRQLVALAEAIPAEKYSWRPAPGVRTTGEVYAHIIAANFGLLSVTGPKAPDGLKAELDKASNDKTRLIEWLKRSQDAVKTERAKLKSPDFARRVKVAGRDATVDGMYLRIIVHANEHMGQLIAYARSMGVRPPWSQGE